MPMPPNGPRARGPPPPPMDLTDSGRAIHSHPPPPPMMMPPFRPPPPFHRGVPFFIREIYKVRLAAMELKDIRVNACLSD